ncbi:MAG: glycosyltransferase [Hyphomicrobiales bacterium]
MPAERVRPRVLFYVQHLLGIGHLARASRIAQGLNAHGLDTLLVTGGPAVGSFPPASVQTVILPVIRSADTGFSGIVDEGGAPVTDVYMARRRDRLVEIFRESRPDAVMIEAFPFGRRQVRGELLALLEAARHAHPRPVIAASIRDIVQPPSKPGRARETIATVNDFFDLLLVHGDPAFAPLEASFPDVSALRAKIAYTGLVAGPPPGKSPETFDVIVSAGGGAAMGRLARAAVEARKGSLLDDARWCVITGPNAPRDTVEGLERHLRPGDLLAPFRADLPALFLEAKLSISQAGYNTCCDLLRSRCAMVLVPFAEGSEKEQTIRSARLEALGRAAVVPEKSLTAEALRAAMDRAMTLSPEPLAVSLEGAAATAALLKEAISAARSA